jgi:hypothetical protein
MGLAARCCGACAAEERAQQASPNRHRQGHQNQLRWKPPHVLMFEGDLADRRRDNSGPLAPRKQNSRGPTKANPSKEGGAKPRA